VFFGEYLKAGELAGAVLVLTGMAVPFLGSWDRRGDSGVA
jgi:hypothetical protein